MAITVTKLAKIFGVSVRTLHWYDKVGLLKPAYHGDNGYRYYEVEQLLKLQRILFFKQLGFELKQIQKILCASDAHQLAALRSHRKLLEKNLGRTRQLLNTIDKTIENIKGTKEMNEHETVEGLSKQILIECRERSKNHTDHSKKEFDALCRELSLLLAETNEPDAVEV